MWSNRAKGKRYEDGAEDGVGLPRLDDLLDLEEELLVELVDHAQVAEDPVDLLGVLSHLKKDKYKFNKSINEEKGASAALARKGSK